MITAQNRREFSASLLAANPLKIQEEVEKCLQASVYHMHLDVMDNNYVPNLALSYDTIIAISRLFPQCLLDIHLMVENPNISMARLQNVRARRIYFHSDSKESTSSIISNIEKIGAEPGIVINPTQSWKSIESILPKVEHGLIMGVQPGFAGQAFQTSCYQHLERIKDIPEISWAIDGSVNCNTLAKLLAYPIKHYVLGSALFKGNIANNIAAIREIENAAMPTEKL
tara:strand:+ start:35 stop:715 length:681 start_codon:yes stop_codon:yes gene_type:complete